MPIDVREAARSFTEGVRGKGGKWERRTGEASREWETNAKSAEAEQAYGEGVRLAADQGLRARGLEPVSSGDFANAVAGRGRAFEEGASARAGKWQNKFGPFAQVIDRVVDRLPAKTPGAARENVMNRVVPIAEALQEAKRQGLAGRARAGAGGSPRERRRTRAPAFG